MRKNVGKIRKNLRGKNFEKIGKNSRKKFRLDFAKISLAGLMIFALSFGFFANFDFGFGAKNSENFAHAENETCINREFILNKDAADTTIVDYKIANPAASATTRYHATENPKSEIVNLTDGMAELSAKNSYEGSSGKVPGAPAGSFVFGAAEWTSGDFITVRYGNFATYGGEELDLIATYSEPTIFPARPAYHTPSIEINKRFYAGFWFTESGQWTISYRMVKSETNDSLANLQNVAALVGSISGYENGNGEYTAPVSGIAQTVIVREDLVALGTTTTSKIPAYIGAAAQNSDAAKGEINVSDNMSSQLFLNNSVQYNLSSANFSLIVGTQNTWPDHALATTNMWSAIYLAPTDDLLLQCPAEAENDAENSENNSAQNSDNSAKILAPNTGIL